MVKQMQVEVEFKSPKNREKFSGGMELREVLERVNGIIRKAELV